MRKNLLVLLLATLPTLAFSQFKLTPQAHGFISEDENPMVLTKYMDPGKAGRNVTWDFRNLEIGNSFTGNINQTLNTKCFSTFSESNVVLEEFGNMFVFKGSDKTLEQVGFMSKNGNTVIKYSKPFVKMRYPFAFRNSFNGDFEGEYIVNNKSIGSQIGVYSVTADARGTLLLPANRQLENVIRVKEIKNYDQTINGSKIGIETITYRWYVENHRFPVLVLINTTYTMKNNKTSSSTMAAYNSNVITENNAEIEGLINISDMNVYPNPYKDKVNIQFMVTEESNVNLAIYDISGRLVKQLYNGTKGAGEAKYTFSAKENGFAAGTYIVRLMINDQVSTRKIIGQ